MDVIGRVAGDGRERACGERGAVPLVRPEALTAEQVEPKRRGDAEDEQEEEDQQAGVPSPSLHPALLSL
jgi:hypothetical protein